VVGGDDIVEHLPQQGGFVGGELCDRERVHERPESVQALVP
jgi:hypothetical protein